MKSSPLLRLIAAAGIYLVLMWGYMALPSGQWFAAFLALMMSVMLIYWVRETIDVVLTTDSQITPIEAVDVQPLCITFAADPSLEASVTRLDSLKSDLKEQYAQFGRDQSLLNSKSLGSWQGSGHSRG